MFAGNAGRPAQRLPQTTVENVLHQGRLARAGNAGDANETSEWDAQIDVFEIILAGTPDHEPVLRIGRATVGRQRNGTAARKILSGHRVLVFQ